MNEFIATDLTGTAPPAICPDCAKLAVAHGPTQTEMVHCRHRLCGAYRVVGRDWKTINGVEARVFLEIVARGLTAGELRIDLERDLAGILKAQAQDATKH